MTVDGFYIEHPRHPAREAAKRILRNDSVRSLIWVYYVFFIVGSIHLTFFVRPINTIIDPMGQMIYNAWAWLPLAAAPVALTGLALRHGGSPTSEIRGRLLRQDFAGLWMQIGGHFCMVIVLGVFIVTSLYGAEHGQPTPSAYWLMAYFIGVTFLTAQCVDKVGVGKGWWR